MISMIMCIDTVDQMVFAVISQLNRMTFVLLKKLQKNKNMNHGEKIRIDK